MASTSPRATAASLKRSQAGIRLLVAVRRAERPDRWDDRTTGDDHGDVSRDDASRANPHPSADA